MSGGVKAEKIKEAGRRGGLKGSAEQKAARLANIKKAGGRPKWARITPEERQSLEEAIALEIITEAQARGEAKALAAAAIDREWMAARGWTMAQELVARDARPRDPFLVIEHLTEALNSGFADLFKAWVSAEYRTNWPPRIVLGELVKYRLAQAENAPVEVDGFTL